MKAFRGDDARDSRKVGLQTNLKGKLYLCVIINNQRAA